MKPSMVTIGGVQMAVRRAGTVVVGAGAAGMNCAVQLVRFLRARGAARPEKSVLVVTGGLALGASRMSGSDKQTYYKMGTSPRVPDTAEDFARTLTAFGCCHGDTAMAEGICSLRGFYNLVESGVPFPHDPSGAFIGYKTDHDPYERATSAGPKTSRFMTECLQAEAARMGIEIVDKHPVVEFITEGQGPERRITAMVCIDRARAAAATASAAGATPDAAADIGLTAFVADNWVLAAGGPGEIYATTVYPRGQVGIHGPALLAGLEACNLTESQFGLASTKFRWNVSGTYMQVVPRIFSTAVDGRDPREFLTEYFDDMPTMATNIFLKGYQWPFDAQRITGHQSSMIDMAVHQETVVRGRRVWMDFLKNPIGKAGWAAFDIAALKPEALDYLRKTGATQARPIDRLAHMNGPAIDIYAENGIDLHSEPLEIAVCAQHMNGGFCVDKWWQSSVRGTFVIGEMAGTHGVKRPGGSALNAGQVGAMRAAEYIAHVRCREGGRAPALRKPVRDGLAGAAERVLARLRKGGNGDWLGGKPSAAVPVPIAVPPTPAEVMGQIGRRMTRYGAHLRSRDGAAAALREALDQYRAILDAGLKCDGPADLPAALAAEQQCLTHLAILKAVCGMLDRAAGSRGSHCVLAEDGIEMHPALVDPATGCPYRFCPENQALRGQVLCVRYDGQSPDLLTLREEPPRPMPTREIAFEPAWAEFRDGKVFEV